MDKNMTSPRHGAPPWRRIGQLATVVGIATAIGVLAPMGAAFGDPITNTGTGQATIASGAYAIGTATTNNIPVSMANFTGTGLLPTAVWSDATGTGAGWKGQVAVSDFTYTGAWTTTTGTALVDSSSSAYSGTQDGVVFTVVGNGDGTFSWSSTALSPATNSGTDNVALTGFTTVKQGVSIDFGTSRPTGTYELQAGTQGSRALSLLSTAVGTTGFGTWTTSVPANDLVDPSSGAYTGTEDGVAFTVVATAGISDGVGAYTWTSTDPSLNGGESTAVANTANPIADGVTINFGTATLVPGTTYVLQVATQTAGVTAVAGTLSADPALVTATTAVIGGAPAATSGGGYGMSIEFVSAAPDTGMGNYIVNPGVTFNADVNSWAAIYTANVQYSIVTGP
jgi:hypothetical protein